MQYEFSDEQAKYLLKQVDNDIQALHNHIATAIERPGSYKDLGGPESLVRKLRRAQATAAVIRGKLIVEPMLAAKG